MLRCRRPPREFPSCFYIERAILFELLNRSNVKKPLCPRYQVWLQAGVGGPQPRGLAHRGRQIRFRSNPQPRRSPNHQLQVNNLHINVTWSEPLLPRGPLTTFQLRIQENPEISSEISVSKSKVCSWRFIENRTCYIKISSTKYWIE